MNLKYFESYVSSKTTLEHLLEANGPSPVARNVETQMLDIDSCLQAKVDAVLQEQTRAIMRLNTILIASTELDHEQGGEG